MGVSAEFLETLEKTIQSEGFFLSGIAPAVSPEGFHPLVQWVRDGYAGEMDYFASRMEAYEHPSGVLESVRSLLVLALPYPAPGIRHFFPPQQGKPSHKDGYGRLARYLWGGRDYHDRIHEALKRIRKVFLGYHPTASVRGVVDTAPLLEREFAQLAGLGWHGKNTMLINREKGSYFFLAALLTDLELPNSAPHETSHCGTCTRCIDACPTKAFPKPGVLDATRCISYLTIEHRSQIPTELRPGIGDWLFGCDVCQEVCPWNQKAEKRKEKTGEPFSDCDTADEHPEMLPEIYLPQLFEMDEEEFRRRFRKTPLWRAKRRGILRNAAIVLGNQKNPIAISALRSGIEDAEPIVRGAAAWALGRIGNGECREILARRLTIEHEASVREEILQGLTALGGVDPLD